MSECLNNQIDNGSNGNQAAPEENRQAGQPAANGFSLKQRVQIFLASTLGALVIGLIGRTMRWEVIGWENWEAARRTNKPMIYTFWHTVIIPATWFWRKRGIVVMTSRNYDGEIIAGVIVKHGYGAARGSSSRGASRALAEMIRCIRRGSDAAFTIDGPRGPRFVAKEGAVLLARATGAPILCFHIALAGARVLEKSWDHHQIPHPFSRAAVFIAPPILVPAESDEGWKERERAKVQATLDDLRRQGEEWIRRTRRTREAQPDPA